MKGRLSKQEIARRIERLAFAKPNDAVKLLFSGGEDIDKLDLRLISQIKRGKDDSLEVKLLDREELLKLLAQLAESDGGDEREKAAEFFAALERAVPARDEDTDEI